MFQQIADLILQYVLCIAVHNAPSTVVALLAPF
jgi:hypothetical protein